MRRSKVQEFFSISQSRLKSLEHTEMRQETRLRQKRQRNNSQNAFLSKIRCFRTSDIENNNQIVFTVQDQKISMHQKLKSLHQLQHTTKSSETPRDKSLQSTCLEKEKIIQQEQIKSSYHILFQQYQLLEQQYNDLHSLYILELDKFQKELSSQNTQEFLSQMKQQNIQSSILENKQENQQFILDKFDKSKNLALTQQQYEQYIQQQFNIINDSNIKEKFSGSFLEQLTNKIETKNKEFIELSKEIQKLRSMKETQKLQEKELIAQNSQFKKKQDECSQKQNIQNHKIEELLAGLKQLCNSVQDLNQDKDFQENLQQLKNNFSLLTNLLNFKRNQFKFYSQKLALAEDLANQKDSFHQLNLQKQYIQNLKVENTNLEMVISNFPIIQNSKNELSPNQHNRNIQNAQLLQDLDKKCKDIIRFYQESEQINQKQELQSSFNINVCDHPAKTEQIKQEITMNQEKINQLNVQNEYLCQQIEDIKQSLQNQFNLYQNYEEEFQKIKQSEHEIKMQYQIKQKQEAQLKQKFEETQQISKLQDKEISFLKTQFEKHQQENIMFKNKIGSLIQLVNLSNEVKSLNWNMPSEQKKQKQRENLHKQQNNDLFQEQQQLIHNQQEISKTISLVHQTAEQQLQDYNELTKRQQKVHINLKVEKDQKKENMFIQNIPKLSINYENVDIVVEQQQQNNLFDSPQDMKSQLGVAKNENYFLSSRSQKTDISESENASINYDASLTLEYSNKTLAQIVHGDLHKNFKLLVSVMGLSLSGKSYYLNAILNNKFQNLSCSKQSEIGVIYHNQVAYCEFTLNKPKVFKKEKEYDSFVSNHLKLNSDILILVLDKFTKIENSVIEEIRQQFKDQKKIQNAIIIYNEQQKNQFLNSKFKQVNTENKRVLVDESNELNQVEKLGSLNKIYHFYFQFENYKDNNKQINQIMEIINENIGKTYNNEIIVNEILLPIIQYIF